MMSTPVGSRFLPRRSRWSRLVVAIGALALSASAWAQTVAVSRLAGTALSQGSADGDGLTTARFFNPKGVAADASGNLYVADSANHTIRRIVIATGAVSTIAGTAGVAGSNDGAGTAARFNAPQGLVVVGANLYVADTFNHTIRRIELSTTPVTVTTLAGSAGVFGTADGSGSAARFNGPIGITVAGGNLYVADTGNSSIRQVVISNGAVSTFAGTSGLVGTLDATGAAARFDHPAGIAADALNVYVADTNNHTIRRIVISSGAVSTISGSAGTPGSTDGTGAAATYRFPAGLVMDGSGTNLYISDSNNHTIRRIVLSSLASSTIAGSAGFIGQTDGSGANARFQGPFGISIDAAGVLYIADVNNQLIRRAAAAVAPTISSSPSNASGAVGASTTATFTVAVAGNPTPAIQWQRQAAGTTGFVNLTAGAGYSGVNSTTLTITGLTAAMNGDQFRAVATNDAGSATSGAAVLTVTQPPVFTSTNSATFSIGTPGTFTISASGSPAPTFSIVSGTFPPQASLNVNTGVITWTPSDTTGAPFTFVVRATNSGGTADQTFTLNVLSGPNITLHPANQTVAPGQNASFTVVASSGGAALTYQWQRQAAGSFGFSNLTETAQFNGTNAATLTLFGVTSSMSGDQYKVLVSSGAGTPALSNAATLTVTQSPQITSLASAVFVENQFNQFQIQATGSPAPVISHTGGSLPFGVTFNNGLLSGTPQAGTSLNPNYVLQFTAGNGVFPDAQQTFTLTISPTAIAPAFTTQPVSVSAALGQTVTFTTAFTGTPTPTIQWQRQPAGGFGFFDLVNDATFSGVQTPTLTITNPTSGMTGDIFRAVASNSNGSAVTNPVTLTLIIGTSLSTYVGSPLQPGHLDGTGLSTRFNTPASIAVDFAGTVYVADASNHVIRRISPGGVVTTLAGQPGFSGSVDGVGSAARFNAPAGIAVNSVGTVYVTDTFNHTIRVISAAGQVTTLAGSPGISGSSEGFASAARFLYPAGIAVDNAGMVYVSDTGNHTIRRIQPDGSVTTLAGAAGQRGALNDVGVAARFASPNALALDLSGNLYVADSFNHAIRRIATNGVVTTFAGTLGLSGTSDNPALFNQPMGVAVDFNGNVLVADTFSHTIRRITSAGVVTTIAGFPNASGSMDGIGSAARLNQPFGVAVDNVGNIYVADTRNHVIRRSGTVGAPVIATHPVNQTAPVGGNVTFTVTATGSPTPSVFQWQRQPAGFTGFSNLFNDGIYSGVNTATLTVHNVNQSMNGDQFRVIASNFFSPDAVSNPAVLTLGIAPTFTSGTSTTFQAANPGTFTVSASGSPSPVYTATGLPSWATIDPNTGVISGTPPDTSGSPFIVAVNASNGITATQVLTIVVNPAVLPVSVSSQPASVAVDQGQGATFSVGATGTAPLTYQWHRNGAAISGATGSTLTLASTQSSNAGIYTVSITNPAGTTVSSGATLVVNTAPILTLQPRTQVALVGSNVIFSVQATGGSTFTYQWRKNGVPIIGASNPALVLTSVTLGDSANYDVQVSNALGVVTSSLVQLNVVTSPTAPVITAQPVARTVLSGTSVLLSVGASGAPAPSFQWRRNGVNITNATGATHVLANVTANDNANYDVVISNSAGSVTSNVAGIRVLARSHAGFYFGSFTNNLGNFALYVREDNSGVFLGYLPGATAPVMSLNLQVDENGQFSFTQPAMAGTSLSAALAAVSVSGTLTATGSVGGFLQGGATGLLSGTRAPDSGPSANVAGFYRAGAPASATTVYTIVGPNTQAFALAQAGPRLDGGLGSVSTAGQVNVVGTQTSITQNISPSTRTVTGTVNGVSVFGASESVLALQRLVNISSRARVGAGESVAIAGFVISGEESKPVLIRAVGPTIGAAPFNVTGALASPRLELFRGGTQLAVNAGVGANRAMIDAAGALAGAFALGASGTDAAILTTLAPGNYTAILSSSTAASGVALIEVYDLSAAAEGQKLLNISTRASAGTAENTLIAGFVVPPGSTKRVLVRGVGPGLAPFGVTGVLAQPTLSLLSGNTTVATNTTWSTSVDAAAITTSSAQVGAFGLAPQDAALIVTLAPGNYTVQVTGAGTVTGVALIEVYELP